MGLTLIDEQTEGILELDVSGKLTDPDFQRLEPVFSQAVMRKGKLRVLLKMVDFHGWKAGALWDEVRFDWRHFPDIDRLAIVGDKAWEKFLSVIGRPFTQAEVKYFDQSSIDAARSWLKS